MFTEPYLRLTHPRDLLSIIPYALGYQPVESLVVVCLRVDGTLGMVARVSFSDLNPASECQNLAQMVARNAFEDEVRHAYLILYTEVKDEFSLQKLKRQAQMFARALQPTSNEIWVVDGMRFYCLNKESGCCPAEGYPVEELACTEASAAMVFKGYAPVESREEYVKLPEVDSAKLMVAQRAELKKLAEIKGGADGSEVMIATRKGALRLWRQLCKKTRQEQQLPALSLGKMAGTLTDTKVRDAVLLSCLPSGAKLANALVSHLEPVNSQVAQLLNSLVSPRDALTPDRQELGIYKQVLESVATVATEPGRVAPLALLAFLAWWSGDGTLANHRLKQGQDLDPKYQLAVMLASALEGGIRPGWIRASNSAMLAA
jgi:hypothetical protein